MDGEVPAVQTAKHFPVTAAAEQAEAYGTGQHQTGKDSVAALPRPVGTTSDDVDSSTSASRSNARNLETCPAQKVDGDPSQAVAPTPAAPPPSTQPLDALPAPTSNGIPASASTNAAAGAPTGSAPPPAPADLPETLVVWQPVRSGTGHHTWAPFMLAQSILDDSKPLSATKIATKAKVSPRNVDVRPGVSNWLQGQAGPPASEPSAPSGNRRSLTSLSEEERFAMLSRHLLLIKRQSIVLAQSTGGQAGASAPSRQVSSMRTMREALGLPQKGDNDSDRQLARVLDHLKSKVPDLFGSNADMARGTPGRRQRRATSGAHGGYAKGSRGARTRRDSSDEEEEEQEADDDDPDGSREFAAGSHERRRSGSKRKGRREPKHVLLEPAGDANPDGAPRQDLGGWWPFQQLQLHRATALVDDLRACFGLQRHDSPAFRQGQRWMQLQLSQGDEREKMAAAAGSKSEATAACKKMQEHLPAVIYCRPGSAVLEKEMGWSDEEASRVRCDEAASASRLSEPWHGWSDGNVSQIVAPRPPVWRQILQVVPPGAWGASVVSHRRLGAEESFFDSDSKDGGSRSPRKAATVAKGAIALSSGAESDDLPPVGGLGDGSRIVLRVSLGIFGRLRNQAAEKATSALDQAQAGATGQPSMSDPSSENPGSCSMGAALQSLAIDHAGLGLTKGSLSSSSQGAPETRAHTRSGSSSEEPVGGNIEMGSLQILPYILQPLVGKAQPTVALARVPQSQGASHVGSASSELPMQPSGDVPPSTSSSSSKTQASMTEDDPSVSQKDENKLELDARLPADYVVAMAPNTIVDDALSTARLFGTSRAVAVGCVVAASRAYNRLFPEPIKPIRLAFDLVSLGETLGIAHFLRDGGFVITNPAVFFAPQFMDLAQRGLRLSAFIQRLEKVQFRVVVEHIAQSPEAGGGSAAGKASGHELGTVTRLIAIHPLFLRSRPWYLPFISYRGGLAFRPTELFTLHALASADGLLESLSPEEAQTERSQQSASAAGSSGSNVDVAGQVQSEVAAGSSAPTHAIQTPKPSTAAGALGSTSEAVASEATAEAELQALLTLSQKAQEAGRRAAAQHAEDLLEAEERLRKAEMTDSSSGGSGIDSGGAESSAEDDESLSGSSKAKTGRHGSGKGSSRRPSAGRAAVSSRGHKASGRGRGPMAGRKRKRPAKSQRDSFPANDGSDSAAAAGVYDLGGGDPPPSAKSGALKTLAEFVQVTAGPSSGLSGSRAGSTFRGGGSDAVDAPGLAVPDWGAMLGSSSSRRIDVHEASGRPPGVLTSTSGRKPVEEDL